MNVRQDAQPAQSGKIFVLKPEPPMDPLVEDAMIFYYQGLDQAFRRIYGYVDKNDPLTDDEVLEVLENG